MTNEKKRDALRMIESTAVAALACQPENEEECERVLNKALASIEFRAYVARHDVESPAVGVQSQVHRNGEGRPDCSRLY